jgi:DnaJ-class molecular chaperone
MADPYSVLGVSKGADEKAIKSAYRKLAKELHPDKNKDNPKATERFSEVTKAYDLLSDKDKRAQFDRGEIDMDGNPAMPFGFGGRGGGQGRGGFRPGYGGNAQGGFGGAFADDAVDLGDIFEGIFGGGARQSGAGAGAGGSPFGRRGGAAPKGGNANYRLRVPFVDAAKQAPQRITLGDGKTIDLKLPNGVTDGMQMRLTGKGERGPGGHGDAIITIDIDSHSFYRREGDDIWLDLPITLDEALNGGKVKVPTVEGAVMLTVPAGSSSGKNLRLKGRGFTTKSGGRGDQIVSLQIELPADTAELAKRLDGWTDGRNVRASLGV